MEPDRETQTLKDVKSFTERPRLESFFGRQIQHVTRADLEVPFGSKQIIVAVEEGCAFEAPSQDGFNLAFVKKACNIIIKRDVFLFFQEFYNNGKLPRSISSTLVSLIPKVEGALSFKEFRPINMVGWLYKLLAKVLENRFKRALPSFVGETQVAFICGRHINFDGLPLLQMRL